MGVTTVRLNREVEDSIDAMANKLQRSRSWLINQAVKEFIERQELDMLRWRETLAAMDSVAKGQTVSGEAVHAWLRSWGSGKELEPPGVGQ